MTYDLAVLEGDDIGLEIVPIAVDVLRAALDLAGVTDVTLHPLPIGAAALGPHGTTFPDHTREALSAMDGVILGPIGHAAYPKGAVNPHPIIRRELDLYANHRPARSYPDLPCLHQDVDLVVLRENNEGFQPDRNMLAGSGEFQPDTDHAYSIRVITARQSGRIARAGFELARQRRGHVTAIHKRTVFKLTDGLFMREVERMAAEYPDVRQIDTAALHLVTHPPDFDVVLCTNMFGDILSDLTAGLVGGLGMAPGLSAGDRTAMAQATHGSAPDIAGTGQANPYAMIMSVQMLVAWLGNHHADPRLTRAADAIRSAVDAVLTSREHRTPDLAGTATTQDMGAAVVRALSTRSPTA